VLSEWIRGYDSIQESIMKMGGNLHARAGRYRPSAGSRPDADLRGAQSHFGSERVDFGFIRV
jgi:hypothetical protein